MINGPDDLVSAVSRDRRMAGYRVRRQGDGWIELEVLSQKVRQELFLVLAWPEVWRDGESLAPHLTRARSGNYGLIIIGSDDELIESRIDEHPMARDADMTALASPVSMTRLLLCLRQRANAILQRSAAATLELELERARHENDMLISIGRALSQERKIKELLATILKRAREVTGADGGSAYIIEGHDDDIRKRTIKFAVAQNESRNIEVPTFSMPVSSASIVGTCVLTRGEIRVPDLYALDAPGAGNNPHGFIHDRSFDDRYHYQTRSVVAVPMISARDEVIGVIQLINKRAKGWIQLELPSDFEHGVVPFDDVSVSYASALASQAGIALENGLLYEEVTTLFESFVLASVSAIEQRDPTTSGHSERVADLTVGLAQAVDHLDTPPFRDEHYSFDDLTQIRYAGLLHDFGKVGVRENVLVKAKKLYEHERDLIVQRFALIKRGYKIEGLESKVRYLMEASRDQVAEQLASIDRDLAARIGEIDDIVKFVLAANEPTVLEQGSFERVAMIAGMSFSDDDGKSLPFLSGNEVNSLQIRRGSLTEAERLEINSHVTHTYNFLSQIPWSRTLRKVPQIAGAHHEKLDGTGYPHGLVGDAIPMPARMMAIADIYDALTANDRPYKKAMPHDKALDILAGDVKRGLLDRSLYEVFVGAQVFMTVQRGDSASRS